MDLGLPQNTIEKIVNLLKSAPEVESIKFFGSRSLGTFKEGSDIDIALFGKKITSQVLRSLLIRYYDLNIPYKLDLLHYESLTNAELKKHIDQYGVTL
jgi:predicted nucleotidyltransferase